MIAIMAMKTIVDYNRNTIACFTKTFELSAFRKPMQSDTLFYSTSFKYAQILVGLVSVNTAWASERQV